MVPYTLDALRDEILTDPTHLGYMQWQHQAPHGPYHGDDGMVCTLINQPRYPVLRSISLMDVTLWMVENDGARRLAEFASDAGPIGAIAQGALTMLTSPHIPLLDCENPRVLKLMQALVPKVFQQQELDQLLALGTVLQSRAEVLWGKGCGVDQNQVANAMGR